MSITVLEGPDLAGKSTIAQQIMNAGGRVQLLKQGPPPVHQRDIIAHYLKPIEGMIGHADIHTVMDRWHVGELIYGPILRDKSMLTVQQADYIDMVLQTFGARFYYVTARLSTLQRRYDKRGDGLIKRHHLEFIDDDYETWMNGRPHWVLHYPEANFTQPIMHEKLRMHSPMAGQYVGPDLPKVLLLGDERNDHRMVFPFVPERATSGHWLMGAMHEASVDHMCVGVMNANEATEASLFTQWEQLHKPPVITLGRKAQRAWMNASAFAVTKTYYMNHPQYERRFHYMQMKEYGEQIKDVMHNG